MPPPVELLEGGFLIEEFFGQKDFVVMDDKKRSDHPSGIGPDFDLLPAFVHAD